MLSIRRHDAEKLLNNIIYLGLNEKITQCSKEVLIDLVNLGEVAQHETGLIQDFFTTLTTFDDYTFENINFAVKKLLQQSGFDVKRYYEESSAAFKRLPETIQAIWLEDWFSANDIETLEGLSDALQVDSEILQDPRAFVSRLILKHLPIFMQSLPIDEAMDLQQQRLLDYRIRKVFQLTLSLENLYKNEVVTNKEFIGAFLWHQITFYQQVKKQREGGFQIVGPKRRNEKIDFLRHILENLLDIAAGQTRPIFVIDYYLNSHNVVFEDGEVKDFVTPWIHNIILYNHDRSKGSHAAKILACLPDQYLEQIFSVTLSLDDLREKAFPGKNLRTAEACLASMFSEMNRTQYAWLRSESFSWSNTSSAANSRASSPQILTDEEDGRSSSFSNKPLQFFGNFITPISGRPPSRRGSREELSSTTLFRPIGIADTPTSSGTTVPDESTPGALSDVVAGENISCTSRNSTVTPVMQSESSSAHTIREHSASMNESQKKLLHWIQSNLSDIENTLVKQHLFCKFY